MYMMKNNSDLYCEFYRFYLNVIKELPKFLIGTIFSIILFVIYHIIMMKFFSSYKMDVKLYIIWTILSNGIAYCAGEFDKDLSNGVMERLAISGNGLFKLSLNRSIVGILHSILLSFLMVSILCLFSSLHLRIDTNFLIKILLGIVYGVSFGLFGAGISLRFHPSTLIIVPVQFLYLFLLSALGIFSFSKTLTILLTILIPGYGLISQQNNEYEIILIIANIIIVFFLSKSFFLFFEKKSQLEGIGS